ncbi:porin, partial [Burkholderia pyrrocinia]
MKQANMAAALIGVALGAGASQAGAQTSVTLYGIVDSGITYTN